MESENIKELIFKQSAIKADSLELFQDGYDNKVYKFCCDKKAYSFRLAKKIKSKEDALFEIEIYNFLSDKYFPVAKIVPVKQSAVEWFVQEWVNGEKAVCSKDIKPDLVLCANAGRVLAKLHAVSEDFKPTAIPSRTVDIEILNILSKKRDFLEFFYEGDDFVNSAEMIMRKLKNFSDKKNLIHNDFRAQNLIIDKNQDILAVLDFDCACIGDPAKDLAHALVEWSYPDGLGKHWQDCWEAFRKGYEEILDIDDDRVSYWVLFSCIADASSYFLRVIEDCKREGSKEKQHMKSYMYAKFKYFENIL